MTTNRTLAAHLGNLAYGQTAAGLSAAETLNREGYISGLDDIAESGDAARLLIALMATDSPMNAGIAVKKFAAAPLRLCVRELVGSPPEAIAPEDVPIEPGTGPEWNRLSHSFVGAVAYTLEMESDPAGMRYPTHTLVRRTLGSPLARLHVILGARGGVQGWLDLWYSIDEPSIDESRMLISAELSMSAHRRLACFARDGGALGEFTARFAMEAPNGIA